MPNIEGLWSRKPLSVWYLEPGSLNIGYLDPSGLCVGCREVMPLSFVKNISSLPRLCGADEERHLP